MRVCALEKNAIIRVLEFFLEGTAVSGQELGRRDLIQVVKAMYTLQVSNTIVNIRADAAGIPVATGDSPELNRVPRYRRIGLEQRVKNRPSMDSEELATA